MIVVVLDMHLIHAMIDVCKILVIVHLIGVSLVSGVNVLLILLHPAIWSTHQLLLSHFNACTSATINLLKEPQEIAIVDHIVKRGGEEVDESE